MGNNVRPAVALLGDINAIVTQVAAKMSLFFDWQTNVRWRYTIREQLICVCVCVCVSTVIMSLILFFKLLECVHRDGWKYSSDTEWWSALKDKIAANAKISKVGFGWLCDVLTQCFFYQCFISHMPLMTNIQYNFVFDTSRCWFLVILFMHSHQTSALLSINRHLLFSQQYPWTTTQCFIMFPSCCHMTV